MTREEILLNFLNLEQPTTKQIIKVLKILIKQNLVITADLFTVNSLTGEKTKQITTKPTQIDLVTDEKIMTTIAQVEASKIISSTELATRITNEVTKQIAALPIVKLPVS